MKKFVIGDIHGNLRGMKQALERSGFNYDTDILISLGDVVDRLPDSFGCVEEFLKIKNLVIVQSNHDIIFRDWLLTGSHYFNWQHGGFETLKSYVDALNNGSDKFYANPKLTGVSYNISPIDIPQSHIDFFVNRENYYIDDDNNLYVHAGFNRHFDITDKLANTESVLLWDRDLWMSALSYKSMTRKSQEKYPFKMFNKFNKVFIGHTPTLHWNIDYPMNAANVWNMDTGAGFKGGKVSVMNIDTLKVFQSDKTEELYEEYKNL
jgi:serine/threonine protein phosphatase 1